MNFNLIAIAVILSLATRTVGYNVLCVFPVPSRSHNLLGEGIVKALVTAGHKVTWVTPYPDKATVKNVELVDLSAAVALSDAMDMTDRANLGLDKLFRFGTNISLVAMENPQLRKILIERQFDAVVAEWFMSDLLSGIAALQQVPYVMFSSVMLQPHLEWLVDDIRSLPLNPMMILHYPIPMNFIQRLTNTLVVASTTIPLWKEHQYAKAKYEELYGPIAAARGQSLPSLNEASHNISVLLVNSHPSISPVLSLPPNVIDIAGFHIDEQLSQLPKDIQKIMDNSPQGVIYFSMGSVLKTDSFPKKMKEDILKIFKDLPFTVLWKLDHALPDVPKNVHIRNWWPQASILAHPNLKLFMTHGGILSTLEAIHHGVPLLAIPVFGDQPGNAYRAQQAGYAVTVPFSPKMAPELKIALDEALSSDKYYMTAKRLSKLFRNRLVPPQKTIAHYVELAVESKGAYHLRSNAWHYSWYQTCMLDQLALIVAVLYVLYRLIKKSLSFCLAPRRSEKKKKN